VNLSVVEPFSGLACFSYDVSNIDRTKGEVGEKRESCLGESREDMKLSDEIKFRSSLKNGGEGTQYPNKGEKTFGGCPPKRREKADH